MSRTVAFRRQDGDEDLIALPVDDIPSILKPNHAQDLRGVLLYTPCRLRPKMAMAFAEIGLSHQLTVSEWSKLSGLGRTSLTGWLEQERRLPFGAAVRLARVFGVPAEELFEGWV